MTTSVRLSSLSCLLLCAAQAQATAMRLAQAVPQIFQRDFQGGFAIGLDGTVCPSDVPVECTGNISNPACCPAGTTCKGVYQYCCPTSDDCKAIVGNFPQCADPSWTLYAVAPVNDYYFCCPPGKFGVLPLTGYGGFCKPDGESIAQSRIATKVDSGVATVVQGTTRTTRTITSISTATDGSVTTVTIVTTGQATITKTTALVTGNSGATANSGSSPTSGSSNSGSNSQNSSSGLSTGTIAGIVIGGLGVLAIFALAFALYRRRQRPNMMAGNGPAPDYSTYAPPSHQQDMSGYKSPTTSYAGMSTVVGTPGMEGQHQQPLYNTYGGPPPPASLGPPPSEIQGHNTWEGRAEMGGNMK